jgi:diaminohydroxyphosphoribosylaminopyrimidine deaminase/5-amino-6-(5-phosphoribosylamino)uracil reductase
LTVRLPGVDAGRLRVVLAPTLAVSPRAKVFLPGHPEAERPRVYVARDCDDAQVARFDDVAVIVRVATNEFGLDLPAVLADLTDAGVESVLVEGGGKTSGAFLCQGLVDEVVLFVADSFLGSTDATPVLALPSAAETGKGWRLVDSMVVPVGRDRVVVGRPEAF